MSRILFIGILGYIFLIMVIEDAQQYTKNYLIFFLYAFIGLIASWTVLYNSKGLLAEIFGVFNLIAFGIVPIFELLNNITYWDGAEIRLPTMLLASFTALSFQIFFLLGQKFRLNIFSYGKNQINHSLSPLAGLLLFFVQVCLFYILLDLYSWHFITLFFREGEHHFGLKIGDNPSFLMIEFFLRPLIFNIGISLFYFYKNPRFISIFGLCIGILAVFPTGVPRFLAVAMYLPFLLHANYLFLSRLCTYSTVKNLFLPNILLLGIFLVFPVLDLFRGDGYKNAEIISIFGMRTIMAGHFDAFQMLARALDVGEISFGGGLVGALLFFIPRSLWSTKPIGSGFYISELSNLSLDNVSMPLVAELYLNFWYFGIVFGGIILGVLVRSIDYLFQLNDRYRITPSFAVYFQFIGLFIFLLRGPLMASFAYSVSIGLTWALIILFFLRFKVNKSAD